MVMMNNPCIEIWEEYKKTTEEYRKYMNLQHSEHIRKNTESLCNSRDEYKHLDLEGLREVTRSDRLPYAVCCVSLHGDLNVGSIVRTANILGAREAIIFGRRKYDTRSTVGAENYFPVTRLGGFVEQGDLELDANYLNNYFVVQHYYPIFVENTDYAIDLSEMDGMAWWKASTNFDARGQRYMPCFVFGNEGTGIPEEILELQDSFRDSFTVKIPQLGVMRCLNVAAAASIVMWDYVSKMKYM